MTSETDPKSRTAATVRSVGHKASGGHSLLTPRPPGNRLHRDPNVPEQPHKEHRRMAFIEFPKWLHFDGEPSVLVQNLAEEAELIAAREPEKRGPGRPKKPAVELPEKVFDLAPGNDPDPPPADPEPAIEPEAPDAA